MTDNASFDPNTVWGGTWEKLESGKVLQSTTDSSKIGISVAAGLPNIKGNIAPGHGKSVWIEVAGGSEALYASNYVGNCGILATTGTAGGNNMLFFDASRSNSIYGNSSTVQPPAKLVYTWHRTA